MDRDEKERWQAAYSKQLKEYEELTKMYIESQNMAFWLRIWLCALLGAIVGSIMFRLLGV